MIILFSLFCLVSAKMYHFERLHGQPRCDQSQQNLKSAIGLIVEGFAERARCLVFITDPSSRQLTEIDLINQSPGLLRYEITLTSPDEFLPNGRNRRNLEKALAESKRIGCGAYVFLITNVTLVRQFIQYAERQRLINVQGSFLLLYNRELFTPDLRYLWNRIINVVFVRQYKKRKDCRCTTVKNERIDLLTVYYPPHKKSLIKYIDSWYHGKLRYGNNHLTKKIVNLQGKTLRVAIFEHMPAVTKRSRAYYDEPPTRMEALGIEFEIMQAIGRAMKFKPKYYMPHNIAIERWGSDHGNLNYTGLLRQAIKGNAAFYLGDLHYTLRHLKYFDLTIPYNTECLTFLTPESLTENSWKLLILPFKLYTWIALILTLIFGGVVFYFFSLSYNSHINFYKYQTAQRNSNQDQRDKNLYLFTEVQNCILYTYSMIVQVSLPGLPDLMAIRILIGWWWIYSILVAVAYRASMTATLANPIARIRIDTLAELRKSSIGVGGWDEGSREFFRASSDTDSQEIGNRFRSVRREDEAIERVANGTFAYYESSYFLRYARVKRQLLQKRTQGNTTELDTKHNLHIMEECTINMPIALGMDKNSPLKPHVDLWIRRMIEVGLVEKWLSDVMEWSKIREVKEELSTEKALVNFHKLQGAFIAIAVGYFLGFLALVGEILYWKLVVLKDPKFDKYYLDTYYNSEKIIDTLSIRTVK